MESIPTLRYYAAAAALKAFSANGITRRLYRLLGNALGQRRHMVASITDVQRGHWLCQQITNLGLRLDNSASVLELGTGWTHFYAIYLRLFFEPKTILFDIQDNRQLQALKRRTSSLAAVLASQQDLQAASVQNLTRQIAQVEGFSELYQLLGMNYIIEPRGKLTAMSSDRFEMVFSVDVLEHVERTALPATISDIYRVLKPGGISIHQIGLDDHLSHYAPGMPSKNYLRYSDRTWKLFFENKVQYFNRIQLAEFLTLFQQGGFELESCQTKDDSALLTQISIHDQFRHHSTHDLQATRAFIVHRKCSR